MVDEGLALHTEMKKQSGLWGRELPSVIAERIEGASVVRDRQGCSACEVWRLEYEGQTARYLKIGPAGLARSVKGEAERLCWLSKHLTVPEVLAIEQYEGSDYLLMAALPGIDMVKARSSYEIERLVSLYAEGLRTIHSVPIGECPFDMSPERLVSEARINIAQGNTAILEQMATWNLTAEAGLSTLSCPLPHLGDDPVLLHGDYCVPNVIVDQGQLSGFIDLDWSGVGDRHWDLACARNSINRNFGKAWLALFLDLYGREQVDVDRIDWFVRLALMI
jgi:aminoglycoside phosphotransferase